MNLEWLSILRLRVLALIHRRRLERDLDEELRFHLETRAERRGAAGMPADDAWLQARREFGNTTHWKERCRDMWTFYWLEMLGQDVRYGLRTLRRSPGFTLVAVVTLALGIAANSAIFSVVNAVMLHPLPYPESARLVELWGNVKRARVERRGTSLPDYQDWRDRSKSFDAMALFDTATFTLTGVDEPERLTGEYVAQPYFAILGVNAALGRVFLPEEDQVPQRDAVAVLSNAFWKRRFGADPNIAGRTVLLSNFSVKVVGVAPLGFRGLSDHADIWIPMHMMGDARDFANRGSRGPAVLARLAPGVSAARAQAELNLISKDLEREHPDTNEGRGVEVALLDRELFGDLHKPLVVLLIAVAFVLTIACTNVANLLLARSEARQREIALRMALGAGRSRVLHQLTTESFLLAMTGGAAGILLARWGIRLLMTASPVTFPSFVNPGLEVPVVLFTAGIACATGLVLGLAPAIMVRTGNLHETFKQSSSRAADSRRGSRFRSLLVAGEVAVAMLLLVGAGLMIRSLRELAAIHPGYDPGHVLTQRVSLPRLAPVVPAGNGNRAATPGATDQRTVIMARDIVNRAQRIPGVESAALSSDAPLTGSNAMFYTAEGQGPVTAQNQPRAYIHVASPGFFQTLRIRFVAGRTFAESETQESNVVIVTEGLVKRFWPEQDPIGKRIKSGVATSSAPWLTIVGVVNDMKYRGLPENPTNDPDVFSPISERSRNFTLLMRTSLDPGSLAPSARRMVREADSTAVVFAVSSLDEYIAQETANSRFTGWLMGIFAAAALLLAVIGIYGVMAYAVSRRTQEIGIRVALGAGRPAVLRLVVRQGMGLIAIGLVCGLAASLGLTRLLGSLLYGVKATDALTFAGAALVLAAVALLACLVPAARASRIAPAVALRNE